MAIGQLAQMDLRVKELREDRAEGDGQPNLLERIVRDRLGRRDELHLGVRTPVLERAGQEQRRAIGGLGVLFRDDDEASGIVGRPVSSSCEPNSAATMAKNHSLQASPKAGVPSTSGTLRRLNMASARAACLAKRVEGSADEQEVRHERTALDEAILPIRAGGRPRVQGQFGLS